MSLRAGDVVCLTGAMGSGKTTFCYHLVRALLGGDVENFSSPTFTVMNQYATPQADLFVNHIDLYRLDSFAEWESLDLSRDAENPAAITLVEWGEKFPELNSIFEKFLSFKYDEKNSENRFITIASRSE